MCLPLDIKHQSSQLIQEGVDINAQWINFKSFLKHGSSINNALGNTVVITVIGSHIYYALMDYYSDFRVNVTFRIV